MSKNIEDIVGEKCRIITATSHSFVEGDKIEISGIYRMYKWRVITKLVYFLRHILPRSWVYEPPKKHTVYRIDSATEVKIENWNGVLA